MTILENILRSPNARRLIVINPSVDREIRRLAKRFWLWSALYRRAVVGVYFDGASNILHLKMTDNGHKFFAVHIDPRTLEFTSGPTRPDDIWLSLHYRWMRVDRIQWDGELLSIQYTGEWTSYINVKRVNNKGVWHLWIPF